MDLSGITTFLRSLLPDIGDMTREGAFILSIVISLTFFGVFIWVTGDIWSGLILCFGLEMILLYVFHVM
jgi:hypothetical protein